MTPLAAQTLPLTVVGALVLGTLVLTWYAARRNKDTGDHYVAGRRIGGVGNGLALAGDQISAASFLGITGAIALTGFSGFWLIVGMPIAYVLVLLLVAEPLRNLGKFTLADVIATRFGSLGLRGSIAIATVIMTVIYMTVQFIGAGLIAGALLDVDFTVAVLVLGVLMTIYTVLGGMVAATYIQIFKTSLLAVMALAVFVAVISRTGWNPIGPMLDATDRFGTKVVEPDRSDMTESVNSLSLTIGLSLGIMGLPHVMLRFLTVRHAKAARESATVAIGIFIAFFLMLPIFGYAALNEIGEKAIVAANPAGNSAGPMLAQEVGGDILYALVAGVTIATILAVLAGMAIAVSGAVAHDLYTNVIRKGDVDERGQLISGRLAGAISAGIAILLAFGAKNLNIANVANIAFAIAASTTMPTLLLTIYWRRFNQIGALFAMVGGLIVSLALVFLGPDVLGKDDAIFPLAIPALVSVPAGFLLAYVGTLIGSGRVGSTGMPYDEFERRAFSPGDEPADGGRFTRRAETPERVGAA
jgi:SSS family solute:Na+ symporter/cation/acetate symporter